MQTPLILWHETAVEFGCIGGQRAYEVHDFSEPQVAVREVSVSVIERQSVRRIRNAVARTMEDRVRTAVQRFVHGLVVQTRGDEVIVSGQARTYHHRQLAEQAALAVVHRRTPKRLVSEVTVPVK